MRKVGDGYINLSSGTIRSGVGGLLTWKLNDIPGYSSWATLSNQYMIYGIKLIFWIPGDEGTVRWYSGSSVYGQGIEMAVCPIHADSSSPITRDDVLNKPHSKSRNLAYGPLKVFIRPSILMETHGGLADTDYTPAWRRWLQCSEVDVPHYGLRYWIRFLYTSAPSDPVFSDISVFVNYRVKYYLKYKGVQP